MCNCGNKFNQSVHQYNQSARNTSTNQQPSTARNSQVQQQQNSIRTVQGQQQQKKTIPNLVNRNINNSEYEIYLRYQKRYF